MIKILICDDSKELRETLELLLKYNVGLTFNILLSTIFNIQLVLKPDVVLMNIDMPDSHPFTLEQFA